MHSLRNTEAKRSSEKNYCEKDICSVDMNFQAGTFKEYLLMLLAFTLLSACELVGEEKNGIFWAVYVQRYIYHWILEIHTHI